MKISVVIAAVTFIGLACLFFFAPQGKDMVSSESLKAKPTSVQEVLKVFPNLMNVKDANELLERVPAHEHEDGVFQHFASHSQFLFADFLENYGSSAPHWKSGDKLSPRHKLEDTEEFKHRLSVFETNLRDIIKLNNVEATHNHNPNRAFFGITQFADWTWIEFKTLLGGPRQVEVENTTDVKDEEPSLPKPDDLVLHVIHVTGAGSAEINGFYWPATQKYGGAGWWWKDDDESSFQIWYNTEWRIGKTGEYWYVNNAHTKAEGPVVGMWQVGSRGKEPAPMVSSSLHPPQVKRTPCNRNWAAQHPSVFTARQQGSCGSCYAHAAVECLRSQAFINSGIDPGPLSAQYAIDCAGNGCDGGDAGNVMNRVARNHGIPTRADYGTYYATAQSCKVGIRKTVSTSGAQRLRAETSTAAKLCTGGPLSMGVSANSAWMHYRGGVVSRASCPAVRCNHDTQVVGVLNAQGAWLIRNSWGTGWGINPVTLKPGGSAGFIMLQYGHNTCNVQQGNSWPMNVKLLRHSANSTGALDEMRLV
jgi:hypothetical protein